MVPLKSLLSSLPEAIRQAVSSSAADAVLALPGEEVEQGLKRGKVSFPWSRLRSMISPAVAATLADELAETAVDLPLPVIAPLFLARKKPAGAAKKVDIGEDIPDVFQGRGLSPAVTQAAAPAAAPAPEPVAAPVATATDAVPKDIGEVFGQPGRRNWTPIEVVQRTSQLNGVAGALIAMQDGLLVAGQLPPGLSGETIAAFIPQMYTRMMQYCKELKFNDASNLTVVVDAAPLKIFKAGGVFFTVLGREGGNLPEPHLSIVASHLEPQGK
jgi:predicted regulator of Ras-like GTPase activity (Roadblock/LC7/MglB family)